jgi:hypothetical protein
MYAPAAIPIAPRKSLREPFIFMIGPPFGFDGNIAQRKAHGKD